MLLVTLGSTCATNNAMGAGCERGPPARDGPRGEAAAHEPVPGELAGADEGSAAVHGDDTHVGELGYGSAHPEEGKDTSAGRRHAPCTGARTYDKKRHGCRVGGGRKTAYVAESTCTSSQRNEMALRCTWRSLHAASRRASSAGMARERRARRFRCLKNLEVRMTGKRWVQMQGSADQTDTRQEITWVQPIRTLTHEHTRALAPGAAKAEEFRCGDTRGHSLDSLAAVIPAMHGRFRYVAGRRDRRNGCHLR